MPWSEEQRAAKEEAAELLAIAKAQPATKKRLTASGKGEEQRDDEKAAIEISIGKEDAARVADRSSRSRRHSSFMLNFGPGTSQTTWQPRRSRSVNLDSGSGDHDHPEGRISSEANAEDLLRSFLDIYDGLPGRRDDDTADSGTKPTSELVKMIRRKSHEAARKKKRQRSAPNDQSYDGTKLNNFKDQQTKNEEVADSSKHKT